MKTDFYISHNFTFSLEDAMFAKEEYEKLLQMTHIELQHLKGLNLKQPLDKLVNDIINATMAKALHLRKMIDSIEDLITEYIVKIEAGLEN